MAKMSQVIKSFNSDVPLVKMADLEGRPLMIMGARSVGTRFGPRIVLDVVLQQTGEACVTMLAANEIREQILDYFDANTEPIGPVVAEKVPTKDGSARYWKFTDIEEEEEGASGRAEAEHEIPF